MNPPPNTQERLQTERNIWLACVQPNSVKVGNLAHNPLVSLSLENGDRPVIYVGDG